MTLPRAGAATGRTGDLPGAKAQGGAGEANALCAASLFQALAAQGVRWVVASPGSRSTPLVLAAHAAARFTHDIGVPPLGGGASLQLHPSVPEPPR